MTQRRPTFEPCITSRCPGPCSAAPPINPLNRREFLARTGNGFGLLALASLLQGQANAKDRDPARSANPLAAKPPMLPAKAKRCIFLFMTGGPSQVDMFDPKPLLNRLDGQPLPPSFGKIHSQFLESNPLCMGSHRKWGKYGQAGLDMSDLVPHLHRHADDIAVIRSCVADSVIHAPAMYQMMTGRIFMGHPSLGSWVLYGLGSEGDNLPAYVVMTQPEGTPEGGAPCWARATCRRITRARCSGADRHRSSISNRLPSCHCPSSARSSTWFAR